MRNKRKVVVQLVEGDKLHNQRLIEYFANKYNERKMKNESERL